MKNLSIEQMEKLGILDYYLELKVFINNYVNENYPLTKYDFEALSEEYITYNIERRNKAILILTNELEHLLMKKIKDNIEFIDSLTFNGNIKPMTIDEYNEEINSFKQMLIGALINYKFQQKQSRTR